MESSRSTYARLKRLARRFLYWLGFKRFYNGRFTTGELLVLAERELREVWKSTHSVDLAVSWASGELYELRRYAEFLEGEKAQGS